MQYTQRFPDRQVGSNAEPLSVRMVQYGMPLDLTAATITFRAADAVSGDAKMTGTGTGASNGVASYQPTLTDLDTAGEYRCQFVATWPGGKVHRSEELWLRVLANH